MDRVILHCDMNNFFASVELLSLPELKGKPVAVSGSPENRHGIILAKNYEAKAFGVQTAETIWQARQKCPGLVLIPPHYQQYQEYYRKINEIYQRFTDLVEPFSIDESWLDVTASRRLFGDGPAIADTVRQTVREELGLTCSIGVSYNKIFAKMGSDYKKPDATTVITRENYQSLLWPLPVGDLFFVGRRSRAKFESLGILTIGDLAHSDRGFLTKTFGKQGAMLYDYANGLDDSPVARFDDCEPAKSIGNGITFRRDLVSQADIDTAVKGIADQVAARIRKEHLKAGGVKVDLTDPLFRNISRQKKLDAPTQLAGEIGEAAGDLIARYWPQGNPIRLLTITGIQLVPEDADEQLSLFASAAEVREKNEKAERLIDSIRERFGSSAIQYGRVMQNDLGVGPSDPRKQHGNF